MVKLTVGVDGGDFEQLPAMSDTELLLESAEFLEADREKGYSDRILFIFEITGGDDAEDAGKIGEKHHVYANMPKGKTGKLSPRSTLYKLLEGMSGGEFNPDDEIDTDEYVGKRFKGDFKRVQAQKNVGSREAPKFVASYDDDGKPVKKTVLEGLKPIRRRKPQQQEEFDWAENEA